MIRTTELWIHCPDLRTQIDEAIAREAIGRSPGLDEVEVNHRTGFVHVVTSNQDGGIDAQHRLVDVGFPPDEVRQQTVPRPETAA